MQRISGVSLEAALPRPRLWETRGLRGAVCLRGKYPQTVPPDATAALERVLWEPSFRIDAAGRNGSSLSWIAGKRGWHHHLVVTSLRVNGKSIPMPEPRSWLNAEQDTLELSVSADRLRSTAVEIDLILFKYQDINDITSGKRYRTAQAEARRNGTPPPIPPTKQPVEFDDEGLRS